MAFALILALVILALTAGIVAPYAPDGQDGLPLEDPSSSHLLGTDRLGRDVLSRTIHGARVSLAVAAGAVAIGVLIGSALGLASGYFGRYIDGAAQFATDLALAFPGIVAMMAIVAAVGQSVTVLIVAIGGLMVPVVMRVVRGSVLKEREALYVESARTIGAPDSRILFRHILPNVAGGIVVLAGQLIPLAILTEAALSFLGFGVRDPTASWGGDLSGPARDYFTLQPWMAVGPGAALTITVFAVNLLGDSIRDAMDPHTRKSTA